MIKTKFNKQSSDTRTGRYISPTPGAIPIIACSLQCDHIYSTTDFYTEFYIDMFEKAIDWAIDCNFNAGIVGNSVASTIKYFKYLGKYTQDKKDNAGNPKFRYIVGCSDLFYGKGFENEKNKFLGLIDNRNIKPYIRDYNNINGIITAWDIFDEPNSTLLKSCGEYIIGVIETIPLVLPWINLMGATPSDFNESDNGSTGTKTTPTFNSYIEYVNKTVHPAVWSYDLYPIVANGSSEYTEYQSFYYDMEVMRHISYVSNEPFWAFCQSMAFAKINNGFICPSASIGTFRLEAFSALAYGAKGILYWTYTLRTPGIKNGEITEYYSSALVAPKFTGMVKAPENRPSWVPEYIPTYDLFKFPAYYAAKLVNSEIRKYEKIFLNTEAFQVRHSGTASIIKDIFNKVLPKVEGDASVQAESTEDLVVCRRLEGAIGPFTKIESCPIGILVSVLVPVTSELEQNSRYIVIVNHDPFNSQIVTMFSRNETVITEITECDKPLNDGTGYSHNPSATSMPRSYNGTVPAGQKADSRVLLPGSYMIFEYESTDLIHDFD